MGGRRLWKGSGLAGLAMEVLYGLAGVSWPESPVIYGSEGTFLGYMNGNPYDINSTADPYGPYGSPYSDTSIKNPYGQFGSPYPDHSATNPYAVSPPAPKAPPVPPMATMAPMLP
jgi:hypothetical protein